MTDVATHCKHCGQKLQPFLIERVPFTKDVLTRIKAGACARDLGWDQTFYLSVCRKHGLTPSTALHSPQTQAPPEIAVIAPPPPLQPDCVYDADTRVVRRKDESVTLTVVQARLFVMFATLPRGLLLTKGRITASLAISEPTAKIYVSNLRTALRPFGITIPRSNSGFCLTEATNGERLQVKFIRGAGA